MAVFAALALGFFSAAVTVAVILRTKQKARGVAAVRLNPFESALLFFLITATMLVSISVSKAFSSFQSDVLKIYVPTLLVQFLTIAVVVFFTRHIGANLNFRPTLRSVKSGVAYFFATLSVLACGGCVAIIYKCVFGEDIERQSAVTLFMNIDGFGAKAMAAFSVVVLAPVAEELFFRGMALSLRQGLDFIGSFGQLRRLRRFARNIGQGQNFIGRFRGGNSVGVVLHDTRKRLRGFADIFNGHNSRLRLRADKLDSIPDNYPFAFQYG